MLAKAQVVETFASIECVFSWLTSGGLVRNRTVAKKLQALCVMTFTIHGTCFGGLSTVMSSRINKVVFNPVFVML